MASAATIAPPTTAANRSRRLDRLRRGGGGGAELRIRLGFTATDTRRSNRTPVNGLLMRF
jgi:hypothetical protein